MQINYRKTKVMVFNPCKSIDFMPDFELEGNPIEVVITPKQARNSGFSDA